MKHAPHKDVKHTRQDKKPVSPPPHQAHKTRVRVRSPPTPMIHARAMRASSLSSCNRSRRGMPSVRAASAPSSSAPLKVVVTGAAGRTGSFVLKKLINRPQQFEARAVVRGDKSKGKVVSMGVKEEEVYFADVASGDPTAFARAFKGADAVVIATSGVPVLKPLSLLKVLWAKLTGQARAMPEFTWKEGQNPEKVDWLGQKAQVDAAKAAGVKHVVVVGSMGGTQPENPLNKFGDNGNILLWKRKAEQYLLGSGLTYTIIHPGGLLDDKGGERKLLLDVDDKLLARTVRNIPREDVAELCVQCLTLPQAKNRAFDCIAVKLEAGESATSDWAALVDSLGGANCDYSIQSQLDMAAV